MRVRSRIRDYTEKFKNQRKSKPFDISKRKQPLECVYIYVRTSLIARVHYCICGNAC